MVGGIGQRRPDPDGDRDWLIQMVLGAIFALLIVGTVAWVLMPR